MTLVLFNGVFGLYHGSGG